MIAERCGRVYMVTMSESTMLLDSDMETSSKAASIVICEPLCYISCKFGKLSNVRLSSILNDFYSSENISEAKKLLVTSIDSLGIETWVKPRNRIQNENKSKIEITDILNAYAFADENMLLNKLPKFVAANVDNLPTTRLEEGDLRCVLNRLEELDVKLDKLDKSDNVISRISSMDNKIDRLSKPLGVGLHNVDKSRLCNSRMSDVPSAIGLTSGKSWADVTATPPTATRNTSSGRDTTYADTDTDDNGREAGMVRLGLHKRPRSSPGQQQPPKRQPVVKKIIGSNTSTCTLKAAKEFKKNKIFCVSNLSTEVTCEQLLQWLNSCNIKVHNIFTAKTKYAESNAFRVNIDTDDVEKFMTNDVWAPNIVIREWVFKPKPDNALSSNE